MDVFKQIGKFEIPYDLLVDKPELVVKLMSEMIVLRCEMMAHKHKFEYVAYHPDFEEIEKYETPRDYELKYDYFHEENDGIGRWEITELSLEGR